MNERAFTASTSRLGTISRWLGLAALGCVSAPDYPCDDATQCLSASGEQGVCTPEHYCAYADAACGQQGLRYSSEASADLASSCLAASAGRDCLVQVSAGIEFSCGVKGDGSVWCWGANDHGQLGAGDSGEARGVPVKVALPVDFGAVSVGCGEVHACAFGSSGSVWCWGGGDALQLGLGASDAADHFAPVEMSFPAAALPLLDMSVGAAHTCVIDHDEHVWCWGENDHEECGQRVDAACPGASEPAECEDVPVPTPIMQHVEAARFVVSGDEFTCAVDDLNELSCWGDNSLGELGIGELDVPGGSSARQTPLPNKAGRGAFLTLDSLGGAPAFAAGAEHACVVVGGSVICWGSNSSGQVGDGNKTPSQATPLVVTSARAVAGGCMAKHTCAITGPNDTLDCWGNNSDGQIGVGSSEDAVLPAPVPLVGVRAAALGDRHTCALVAGLGMYCWGANDKGQLGLPPSSAMSTPVPSDAPLTICR